MNIGTKGISLKFGLVILALGIVAFLAIRNKNEKKGAVQIMRRIDRKQSRKPKKKREVKDGKKSGK